MQFSCGGFSIQVGEELMLMADAPGRLVVNSWEHLDGGPYDRHGPCGESGGVEKKVRVRNLGKCVKDGKAEVRKACRGDHLRRGSNALR